MEAVSFVNNGKDDVLKKYGNDGFELNKEYILYGRIQKIIYRDGESGYTSFSFQSEERVLSNDKNDITTYNKKESAEIINKDFNKELVKCSGILHDPDILSLGLKLKGTYVEVNKKGNKSIVFKISKYTFFCGDSQSIISFLSSGIVKGLGIKKAEKIAQKVEEIKKEGNTLVDNFLFAIKDNYIFEEILKRIPELVPFAEDIQDKVKKMYGTYDMYLFLLSMGLNHSESMRFINNYSETKEAIDENIYKVGIHLNFNFSSCDKIAKNYGYGIYDNRRLDGIINYALKEVEDNGDCFSYLYGSTGALKKEDNLINKINNIQKQSIYDLVPIPLILTRFLKSNEWGMEAITFENNSSDYMVYKKNTYKREEALGKDIMRLYNSAISLNFDENYISVIEKELNITYAPEQKLSFNALKQTGISIITGGPGTGKTTLVNGLIKFFKHNNPDKNIINLCSPTGRAASRLGESTNMYAETFHRFLKYRPFDSGVCKFNEFNPHECDLLILDEMSMAGLDITAMIMNAIKNGALILFVGDVDQLESVEKGNIFSDLIGSEIFPVYRLKTVFRQVGDNTIVQNAIKINEFNADVQGKAFSSNSFFVQNDKFSVITVKKDIDSLALSDLYVNKNFQILTPTIKDIAGTKAINSFVQEMIHDDVIEDNFSDLPYIIYGESCFYLGDKVIATSNNYDVEYFNGEIGEVTDVISSGMEVTFNNGKVIFVKEKDLSEFLPAYAITIHKSQGSEFEKILIILPEKSSSLLSKKVLYTGITRAKKEVVIIEVGNAIEKCLTSPKNLVARKSNLIRIMRKIACFTEEKAIILN